MKSLACFVSPTTARQRGNQNEKSRIHHEGTKDTKGFVGCASRTDQSRMVSRKGAKAAKDSGGKFEARNPKLETISNDKKPQCSKQPRFGLEFRILIFRILDLFRSAGPLSTHSTAAHPFDLPQDDPELRRTGQGRGELGRTTSFGFRILVC